ncbi:MAG TPA: M14 family metallopeptidase [Candidatus Limnocylindrales bacterium]|nr:M14 family metallopeptidase [Candidatus Limnocylindrales bacterium]
MRPNRRAPVRLTRLAPLLLAAALALPAAAPAAAAEPDFPASNSGYHNWPELVDEIMLAAADYPAIVSVFSIGKSYQGRDIWMAKVSDNAAEDEPEPEVLVDALHHAREHLTTEQALALLRWLTTGYGADETITRLVDTRETFIIFALNPDGMRYDLTGNPYRAWRKNRQLDSAGKAMYTDLNRNYDYRWGCCGGSSGSRASITYRGPRPFSAPETRALRDFVNSRVKGGVQQIRTHVTLHTNGELILWPYGYTKTNVPPDMTQLDYRVFVSLGRAMAARNGYRAQQSSDLYITDGDQIDWLYAHHRIFTYTYELYPTEKLTVWGDHYPDDSGIEAQTERNRSALLLLVERAACPYAALGSAFAAADCGPLFDDLEINRGWTRNAAGTDTATSGFWAVANPATTTLNGPKQAGTTVSGVRALVTGATAGANARANDVDRGTTTIRSRAIPLPADPAAIGALTLRYVFAHDAAATPEDAFRVLVEAEDGTLTPVIEVLGKAVDRDATWASASASVGAWAGQTIHLVVQAADGGVGNLVEAAVDDVRIRRP